MSDITNDYVSDLIQIDAATGTGFGVGGLFVAVPTACRCGQPATHYGPATLDVTGYCDHHAAEHDTLRAWGQGLSLPLQEQWRDLQIAYDDAAAGVHECGQFGLKARDQAEARRQHAERALRRFEAAHGCPVPTFNV